MRYNLVEMASFGTWLREKRKQARLTQDELSRKSGVSASYISTLEREQPHSVTGARLRPEPDKVRALAAALGQDPSEPLTIAGYAGDRHDQEILDGMFVSFDERRFTKAEQEQFIETMRIVAAGVRARNEPHSSGD